MLERNDPPSEFCLYQNYPNPFNPETVISYYLPEDGNVELKILNGLGKEVMTIFNKEQNAGDYRIKFDGNRLSSGIYLYRIKVIIS